MLRALATACLVLSCLPARALDSGDVLNSPPTAPVLPTPSNASPTPTPQPPPASPVAPPIVSPLEFSSPDTPSLRALPASLGPGTGTEPFIDASNFRKFFTFSAEIRGTYDSNVGTNANATSSYEVAFSPSIVFQYQRENTQVSASASTSVTQYFEKGQKTQDIQLGGNFAVQAHHDFSERFSLNMTDQLNYSPEPNLLGTTGTPYRNGDNLSNSFSAGLSSQWTPLVGTQLTYSNTAVQYANQPVAEGQNSLENNGSASVSFAVLPKISVNFGGIVDNTTYDVATRGYTSYTGFLGSNWQALPSINVSARAGGSETESKQLQGNSTTMTTTSSSLSPYVDLNLSWQIGERSTLTADYSHEITPTDQTGASGQQSDRVSANFSYQVLPKLSTYLQGIYTYSDISNSLVYNTATLQSYNEAIYELDTGANYQFAKYFSLNLDVVVSGVSSQISERNYSRDQLSIGIRGTY
jgi:hypothetical protein